mmetsp:Transcript_27726/g.55447  ORF Transcript_27726/g.55447 Transcript_27726/m.55447 type:complete len:290 (+) Transcript_27726:32-901(+)
MANTTSSTQANHDEIKTMKLYTHVERIKTELFSRGMLEGDSIDPIALSEIDSMHYMGNNAIKDAIDDMKLDASSKVLDVGSGFGGPARILSVLSKCSTVALEIQPDIHELAEELTKRCQLSNLVKHSLGNILDCELENLGDGPGSFDGIVSFLVFLHIPDKKSLLDICSKMLKSGGSIFVEDFYCRSPFSDIEVDSLQNDVFCKDVPTREEYISYTEAAGFRGVKFIEKSNEWKGYVTERLEKFKENKARFIELHGEPTYQSLLHFYSAVAALFVGGNLGGVCLIAKKI